MCLIWYGNKYDIILMYIFKTKIGLYVILLCLVLAILPAALYCLSQFHLLISTNLSLVWHMSITWSFLLLLITKGYHPYCQSHFKLKLYKKKILSIASFLAVSECDSHTTLVCLQLWQDFFRDNIGKWDSLRFQFETDLFLPLSVSWLKTSTYWYHQL